MLKFNPFNVLNTLFFMLFSMSFTTMAPSPKIDLQGHRGCRGLLPENTIPAMLEAIRLGVTTIEMDVVITADKKVVVSHDPYMNADFCTDPQGKGIPIADQKKHRIYAMTYAEVAQWDVGMKVNEKFLRQKKMSVHKPLLSALIDSVEAFIRVNKFKPVRYNIETKSSPAGDGKMHPAPDEFVRLLMEVLKEKGIEKRVTVQSFDKRTLQVLKKVYPKMTTSYLIEFSNKKTPQDLISELGFRPDIISPDHRLVDSQFLEASHAEKLKVIAWTVNNLAEIQRLVDLGVDGIISDYPDLFAEIKLK